MSRKQSAYLQRVAVMRQAEHEAIKRTYEQYLADTAVIALNNLGWGETKIRRFVDEWSKTFNAYSDAIGDGPETDYCRAKIDERLRPICKQEEFVPFEDRYTFLPEVKY